MGARARALRSQAGDRAQPGRAADRREGRPTCSPQAGGGQEGGAQEGGARPTGGEEEHEAALSAAAWALLAVAAALAVGDWVAVALANTSLEYVCKPAVMAALIGVAVTLDPAQAGRRDWFVAALVLSPMVSAALATGIGLAIAGAVLFFASDTLIAWNRFVAPRPWMRLAIIVTYHLGQGGLVLSLAR